MNPELNEIVQNLPKRLDPKSPDFGHKVDVKSPDELHPKEKYQLNVINRLIGTSAKYISKTVTLDDFLVCLRDYLLSVQNGIVLPGEYEIGENEFGIDCDSETGIFQARMNLPKYITRKFVEDVYSCKQSPTPRVTEHNLTTDSKIRELTGYQSFKSFAQKLAVYGARKMPTGTTALITLPTGSGKSLITQTLAFDEEGLTVVVIPTVALAIDQANNAAKKLKCEPDAVARYIGGDNIEKLAFSLETRKTKLLFTSPEAILGNPTLKDLLEQLNSYGYLKNLVIDEAHIITDWGAAFRPDFQVLQFWKYILLKENPKLRTYLLTATIDDESATVLKNLFSKGDDWREFRLDEMRREPRFIQSYCNGWKQKMERTTELVRLLPHPLIVYVSKPKEAEQLAERLRTRNITNIELFTGKTNQRDRDAILDRWIKNEFSIMIATSAFGVGVDKPDVRTVIHNYVPSNANAYYQELGRGGRDGLACLSVMNVLKVNDFQSTRGQNQKSILSAEKMIQRWETLISQARRGIANLEYGSAYDYYTVDVTLSPSYSSDEEDFEGLYPAPNVGHMKWNLYTLLLLLRNGYLEIDAVQKSLNSYFISLKNINPCLLEGSREELAVLFERLRNKESQYKRDSFHYLEKSVYTEDECWSEMFFDTYEPNTEYCAGCRAHKDIEQARKKGNLLKKEVRKFPEQIQGNEPFKTERDTIVVSDLKGLADSKIINENRVDFIIDGNSELSPGELLKTPVMVINPTDANRLQRQKNTFFISGLAVVLYPPDAYKSLDLYRNSIFKLVQESKDLVIIHMIPEDWFIQEEGKKFSEIIKGKVISKESL